ncbi:MAG: type II toxin-antitoxin system prevent-host-death family antitoxin [Anaerolineales bacterium]|nr:type II toxin-antitoxin system prevent-host-death family antitoxin [Anaerolineales bacterium]
MKQKQQKTEEIGIRELKIHVSEVIRAVKEKRARYIVTQRGVPAALIIPLDAVVPQQSADEVWERLMNLGKEIGQGWQNEKSAAEILSEMRR